MSYSISGLGMENKEAYPSITGASKHHHGLMVIIGSCQPVNQSVTCKWFFSLPLFISPPPQTHTQQVVFPLVFLSSFSFDASGSLYQEKTAASS